MDSNGTRCDKFLVYGQAHMGHTSTWSVPESLDGRLVSHLDQYDITTQAQKAEK